MLVAPFKIDKILPKILKGTFPQHPDSTAKLQKLVSKNMWVPFCPID